MKNIVIGSIVLAILSLFVSTSNVYWAVQITWTQPAGTQYIIHEEDNFMFVTLWSAEWETGRVDIYDRDGVTKLYDFDNWYVNSCPNCSEWVGMYLIESDQYLHFIIFARRINWYNSDRRSKVTQLLYDKINDSFSEDTFYDTGLVQWSFIIWLEEFWIDWDTFFFYDNRTPTNYSINLSDWTIWTYTWTNLYLSEIETSEVYRAGTDVVYWVDQWSNTFAVAWVDLWGDLFAQPTSFTSFWTWSSLKWYKLYPTNLTEYNNPEFSIFWDEDATGNIIIQSYLYDETALPTWFPDTYSVDRHSEWNFYNIGLPTVDFDYSISSRQVKVFPIITAESLNPNPFWWLEPIYYWIDSAGNIKKDSDLVIPWFSSTYGTWSVTFPWGWGWTASDYDNSVFDFDSDGDGDVSIWEFFSGVAWVFKYFWDSLINFFENLKWLFNIFWDTFTDEVKTFWFIPQANATSVLTEALNNIGGEGMEDTTPWKFLTFAKATMFFMVIVMAIAVFILINNHKND